MSQIIRRIFSYCFVCIMIVSTLFVVVSADDQNSNQTNYFNHDVDNDQQDFSSFMELNKTKDKPLNVYELDINKDELIKGNYTKAVIDSNNYIQIKTHDFVEWQFSAEEGLYKIEINYIAKNEKESALECSLCINDIIQYREANSIELNRTWENDKIITDNRNNQLSPSQKQVEKQNKEILNGTDNISSEYYYFNLKNGSNSLKLTMNKGSIYLKSIKIFNSQKKISYNQYKAENSHKKHTSTEFYKQIQAEDANYKSSSNLYPFSDRSTPEVSPNSAVKSMINVIGGDSWGDTNQWISWNIEIPNDGLYTLNFKYRQSFVRGLQVRRAMKIDGQVLFDEMNDIRFPYSNGWEYKVIGKDDNPYQFYLTKGKHEIRLECVLGNMTDVLSDLTESLKDLNYLYRRIIMITGISPDPYNDYYLHKEIPGLIDTFKKNSKALYSIASKLENDYGTTGSAASSLYDIVRQLDSFCDKPNSIPQRLDSYKSNLSVLGDLIFSLKKQPLQLDLFTVSSNNKKLKNHKCNIFETMTYRFKSFLVSFSKDYGSIGNRYNSDDGKEPLDVWISSNDLLATGVSSGRDQATTLKRFIDEQFTLNTGINVNLNLVSTSDTLLQSIVGDKSPDVALFVPKALPITLAIRGAIEDLSKSSYFESWRKRVYSSSFIPYEYNGGVFGMPETQVFNVLYYRKDILKELNIQIPNTWDEFYKCAVVIEGKNLELGISADQSTLEMLLLQKGKSIYNEDLSRIALSDPVAIDAFKMWTDFYCQYGIPLQYDFFNRFRTGEMPMAIAPLTVYNQLSIAAPEINNIWGIAPIPGTELNGEINRSQSCITTASVIMNKSKNKDSAYKFIDWWTSDDVQSQFGNSMENLMGSAARYNTANKNAFETLPWTDNEKQMISYLWKDVSDIPQTPASYYINRNILNAFRRVVYYNETPREVINKYSDDMNKELIRKRKEFNLE